MSRSALIKKLGAQCAGPLLVVASSWRADMATDLDGQAARAVVRVLEGLETDELTIFVAARGGDVAFADRVIRFLHSKNIAYDLVVPTLVTGAAALLALAARRVRLHPNGGVGAYDSGPLRTRHPQMTPGLFDDVPALGGIRYENDPGLPTRLASGLQQRRLARELARRISGEREFDALSHLGLGQDLGLGAPALEAAGFDASTWDEAAIWELYCGIEAELGVLHQPEPPYTESDLGDEVEFTPAVGLLAILVATVENELRYELDTGAPDPDTGVYAGAWNW